VGNQKTQELSEIKRNLIMAKHRYTIRVKKVVIYDEKTIQVVAENEVEAKRLAKKEAEYKNWVDVDTVNYKADVYSYTCKPVEE
jgi:hypothetical protein